MTDRYVPAWYDYGIRKGPILAVLYHMAEGGGTVGYLDNKGNPPDRGVSVHGVIEYDGSYVQMLPYTHASGSLNPDDRSTNKAYYGHDILVAVLGDWWKDPNSVTISFEIEGFAKDGPNDKQVATLIRVTNLLKGQFDSLVGAIGHADQTDTKPCPGTTSNMKSIFEAVGGHGVWLEMKPVTDETPALIDVNKGNRLYEIDGTTPWRNGATLSVAFKDRPSPYAAGPMRAIYLTSGANRYIALCYPNAVKPIPVPPQDCTDEVAQAITEDRAKAHIVYDA